MFQPLTQVVLISPVLTDHGVLPIGSVGVIGHVYVLLDEIPNYDVEFTSPFYAVVNVTPNQFVPA